MQPTPSYSAAASLLAVLSDEPTVAQSLPEFDSANIGYATNESQFDTTANVKTTKKEKAKPKAEPIKLKIKTNARLRNNTDLTEPSDEPEIYRGRSTRRTTPQHTNVASSIDDNVPVPGTANYELYRTLTESPTHNNQQSHFDHTSELNHHSIPADYQQFHSAQLPQANIPAHLSPDTQNTHSDTERGILPKKRRGRNKAKFEANTETVVEETVPKRQRGRRKHDEQPTELTELAPPQDFVTPPIESPTVEEVQTQEFPKKRITAAAKKQYRDESSTVVTEQPIIAPVPVEEPPHPSEEVQAEPVTNRRGRKAKAKANQNITNTDQMSQSEVSQRPTRSTRHTANGNMTRVSSVFNSLSPCFAIFPPFLVQFCSILAFETFYNEKYFPLE